MSSGSKDHKLASMKKVQYEFKSNGKTVIQLIFTLQKGFIKDRQKECSTPKIK